MQIINLSSFDYSQIGQVSLYKSNVIPPDIALLPAYDDVSLVNLIKITDTETWYIENGNCLFNVIILYANNETHDILSYGYVGVPVDITNIENLYIVITISRSIQLSEDEVDIRLVYQTHTNNADSVGVFVMHPHLSGNVLKADSALSLINNLTTYRNKLSLEAVDNLPIDDDLLISHLYIKRNSRELAHTPYRKYQNYLEFYINMTLATQAINTHLGYSLTNTISVDQMLKNYTFLGFDSYYGAFLYTALNHNNNTVIIIHGSGPNRIGKIYITNNSLINVDWNDIIPKPIWTYYDRVMFNVGSNLSLIRPKTETPDQQIRWTTHTISVGYDLYNNLNTESFLNQFDPVELLIFPKFFDLGFIGYDNLNNRLVSLYSDYMSMMGTDFELDPFYFQAEDEAGLANIKANFLLAYGLYKDLLEIYPTSQIYLMECNAVVKDTVNSRLVLYPYTNANLMKAARTILPLNNYKYQFANTLIFATDLSNVHRIGNIYSDTLSVFSETGIIKIDRGVMVKLTPTNAEIMSL